LCCSWTSNMSEVPRRQGKVFDPSASAKETPQDAEQAVAAGVEVLENLQPLLDPNGTSVWEPRYDAHSNRVYWINHELRQTCWTVPGGGSEGASSSPAASASPSSNSEFQAPGTPTLPEGWERKIDLRTGRAYYLNHNDKSTSWDFPIPGKVGVHQTATQQTECTVCFDPMFRETVAAFMKGPKRSCRHFLHFRCAMQLQSHGLGRLECPMCRTKCHSIVAMPNLDLDPDKWFELADFDGKGQLSQEQIADVLCAQFPVDYTRLIEELPSLWPKWDVSGTGFITLEVRDPPPKFHLPHSNETSNTLPSSDCIFLDADLSVLSRA